MVNTPYVMKRQLIFAVLFVGMLFFGGCSEDHNGPTDKDGVPPQPIDTKSITVTPLPGGAVIRYAIPDEPDLLAVEARYQISSGKEYTVRASVLVDSLVVEGWLEQSEHPVVLYAVDRAENYSTPVTVYVLPDEAPINTIFSTLSMTPDFGGVMVSWKNPSESPIAIYLLREEENGDLTDVDAYYTKAKEGKFAVRGQEAKEMTFRLQLRDKWQNYSDYYTQTLRPLFEQELDYEKFSPMELKYSNNISSVNPLTKLWLRDLKVVDRDHITDITTQVPWNASFSIGDTPATFSRIVIWQYGWAYNNYGVFYSGGNARTYEFYGSNNPTPTGELDESWELFLTADIVKPSGEPYNAGSDGMTDEDFDIAFNRGHEFMVPLGTPKYKYVRMKCLRTFENGSAYGHSYRIQVFGTYND